MAFAIGNAPNPGHCETIFDGIIRSLKEWASRGKHKPSCEKDFSPDVLHLIGKLDEALQLCQKSARARKKLRKEYERICSVLINLEKIIADPKVTKHKELCGKKQASSSHQECSQTLKHEQQVLLDHCEQESQQVDDFTQTLVSCEPRDGIDLSELVPPEESTTHIDGNGAISDHEHKPDLDSGLIDVYVDSDEDTDDVNRLKKIISGLKSQIIGLNNDIDKLRRLSREQSRQVLKYKQEAEVSDMKGQQLVEVERMQNEAKKECVHLHEQLKVTSEELRHVRNEKQVVEKEYAQLKRTLISMGSLSSQLMEVRQEHSQLRQHLTEKENENAAIRSQQLDVTSTS